jgi:hypothetical protein
MEEEDWLESLPNIPTRFVNSMSKKGVSMLLTRNPKSIAGKELKQFNDTFIKLKLTKSQFIEQIENYLKINQDYLNEMSETDPKQYKLQHTPYTRQ